MNEAFATALAAHGASLITHIQLYNAGTPVGAARQPVTWTGAGSIKNPSANLVFSGTASTPITEWRGFTALTGGTDYGGATMTGTGFDSGGVFTLLAASTNFDVSPV